jgi:hypothetical protein
VAIVASGFVGSIILKTAFWIVGFILTSFIHIVFIRLVPR